MSVPPFAVSLIILDVDGTLVDFVGAMRNGLTAVARDISKRAGGAELQVDRLNHLRNQVAQDLEWQNRDLNEIRRESFRRMLAQFDQGDSTTVDAIESLYYTVRRESMVVFPDVEESLIELRQQGLRLIAASNGNLSLASVGLDSYFEDTHYAEEVGISKPNPAFFTRAVKKFEGSTETTLAVGDRLDNDYEPALAAGLHAVLIDRTGRIEDTAIVRITALTELPRLIQPT